MACIFKANRRVFDIKEPLSLSFIGSCLINLGPPKRITLLIHSKSAQ